MCAALSEGCLIFPRHDHRVCLHQVWCNSSWRGRVTPLLLTNVVAYRPPHFFCCIYIIEPHDRSNKNTFTDCTELVKRHSFALRSTSRVVVVCSLLSFPPFLLPHKNWCLVGTGMATLSNYEPLFHIFRTDKLTCKKKKGKGSFPPLLYSLWHPHPYEPSLPTSMGRCLTAHASPLRTRHKW